MASEAGQAARQICEMLSGLVGRSVSPEAVASPPKIDAKPAYIATYVNEDGSVVGLCRCDLAAAASLGAALSMLPAGRVDDCIRSSSLDEMLYENFWEVCNVLVRVFNAPHQPVLSLKTMDALPLSSDAGVDLAAPPSSRVDVGIAVQGYQDGILTLMRV